MCEPMTIMAGVGAASAGLGEMQKGQAWAAQETARRKNIREAVRQANYQDAALIIQDKQNLANARRDMTGISIDQIKANSSVKTAIGESNLEGRSMERVARDVDNQFRQSKVDVQRNYDTEFTNVWAERDSVRNNLISTVQGSAAMSKPSVLSGIVNTVAGGVQGAIAGSQLDSILDARSDGGKTTGFNTKKQTR